LLIDSGSSGSISLQPGRELPWVSAPLPVSVGQGMEKLFYHDVGRLDADIEIAGVNVSQPIVKIGAITELIGTDVMRRFAWTFDQKSRRVRIRPDSSDPLRLPPKRGTGAILFPTLEGYEIARVLEDSPATRAGLRAGDVVVAVDGTRVFEQGCDRWKGENRTEVTLTVLRDGETSDLRVEIVDIVP
jgi:membrane-associated protease RseP (regulator of RpoE activity)